MLIRHMNRWDYFKVVDGGPSRCIYDLPTGKQCGIYSSDADKWHTWDNPNLLEPVGGTLYVVTFAKSGGRPSWPIHPPMQTVGYYYGEDIKGGADVICLSMDDKPVMVAKEGILAITDDTSVVPDLYSWLIRVAVGPRCLAKCDLEDQVFPAQCKLPRAGHGGRHCGTSVMGNYVWWDGEFFNPGYFEAQAKIQIPRQAGLRGLLDRILRR